MPDFKTGFPALISNLRAASVKFLGDDATEEMGDGLIYLALKRREKLKKKRFTDFDMK